MKILVVLVCGYYVNGIANVVRNIYRCKEFEQDEISFLFLPDSDPVMVQELENDGRKVYLHSRNGLQVFKYFNYVKGLISEECYEIVHVHGNSHTIAIELLAAKLGGCSVRIAHAHSESCKYKIIHKILTPVFNYACTLRFACSRAAGEWMYGNKKYYVIKNGIFINDFIYDENMRENVRKRLGYVADDIVIGHVGTVNKTKNQEYLVKIFSLLEEKYKLLLVGDGPKMEEIKGLVKNLNIEERICFVGETREVPSYLSAMDIFVMPSLHEGFGIALLEAQVSGLLCIASDSIPEDVNITKNVLVVSLKDTPKVWCDVIKDMKINKNRMKKSIMAMKKVQNCGYGAEDEAEKLRNYYTKLCSEKMINI